MEDPQRQNYPARRPVRRDCEPHRGGFIFALGVGSLLGSLLGPVGLALGLAAFVLGRADRRQMEAGERDPAGEAATRAGEVCGLFGACFSLFTTLGYLALGSLLALR